MSEPPAIAGLPGEEIVSKGLDDLAAGRTSLESLLVEIGANRMRAAGMRIPEDPHRPMETPEHRLFHLLEQTHPMEAYARYNSLIRRLVSFERALEHRGATGGTD